MFPHCFVSIKIVLDNKSSNDAYHSITHLLEAFTVKFQSYKIAAVSKNVAVARFSYWIRLLLLNTFSALHRLSFLRSDARILITF